MEWKIRELLMECANLIPDDEPVACFLSSGVDSHSILFSLLEAKKKVTAYTFHVSDIEPKDLRYAVNTCKVFGVPHVIVPLNMNLEYLVRRVVHMKEQYQLYFKTDIESFFPFLESIPYMKEKYAITGSGADAHFVMPGRFDKKEGYREQANLDGIKLENIRYIKAGEPLYQRVARQKLFNSHGVQFFEPYTEIEMYSQSVGATWDEMHKPNQKQPIRDTFPEYFAKTKVANHQGLQDGDSEISLRFGLLLKSGYNIAFSRSMQGMYNRMEYIAEKYLAD